MRIGRFVAPALAAILALGLGAGAFVWVLSLDPISDDELEETLAWAAETRAAIERESCARNTPPGVRDLLDERGVLAECWTTLRGNRSMPLYGCSTRADQTAERCWTWADHVRPALPPLAPDTGPFRSSFALPYREGEWPESLVEVARACAPVEQLLPGALEASDSCSPHDLGHGSNASDPFVLDELVDVVVALAMRWAAGGRGRAALEIVLDGVRLTHDARRGDVPWSDARLVTESEARLWIAFQTLLDLELGLAPADLDAIDARLVALREAEPGIARALRAGAVAELDERVRALVPGETMNTRFEAIAWRDLHERFTGSMNAGSSLFDDVDALDALIAANPRGDRDDWRWLWLDEATVLSRSVQQATARRVRLEQLRGDTVPFLALAARVRGARVALAVYRARGMQRCPNDGDIDRRLLDTPELGGPLAVRGFPPADVLIEPPPALARDVAGPLFVLTCVARPVETAGHWIAP